MRLSTFFILFILVASQVLGQTTIRGKITDQAGLALPGANILLQDSYDGTTSDANGEFSFTTDGTGNGIVVIRFVGYEESITQVTLDGKPIDLRIGLKETINQLDAVTISAGAFTAGEQGRRTIFKAIDIATTAGATADIAGALNTLPGTQKVGESGRLFVRGGDGSETRTFIDGMLVLDAYSPSAPNTPSRARFLPFMFKGTSFSTGGYSAEFGQALSSALALDSKDESEVTRTDIGLLSVGADVAHTQAWESGSAAAKIQYTNIRPYFGMINQEIDWKTPPASLESIGAVRQRIGKEGILKIYGNFSGSDFSLYQHDIDDDQLRSYYRLRNGYSYGNVSYRGVINKNWGIRSGFAYSAIRNESSAGEYDADEKEKAAHIKTVVDGTLARGLELKTGAELTFRRFDEKNFDGTSFNFDEYLPALFAEFDIYASSRFVSRVGGRAEFNSMSSDASVDPRLSVAYKFDNSAQVSLAFGRFRQTPVNRFLKVSPDPQSEKALHYILNYQIIKNNRTFRIEGFFKQYDNLVTLPSQNMISYNGNGFAKGIELFWRDNASIRALDYWISYSLLDTRRNYLDFPYEVTPSFASKHNFSAVAKYFVRQIRTQIGATYSYTSGRPYNNPNEDTFNGSRTPAYQDLSVNLSYLPAPQLIIYLSCTNVPGYKNVFGYEYSDTRGEDGLYNGRAIRPAAPRFIFLGVFITLSKNKSISQLPEL